MNLQSFLATREKACEQFNEFFKPAKPISVKVRSDLKNIIKSQMNAYSNFKNIDEEEEKDNE